MEQEGKGDMEILKNRKNWRQKKQINEKVLPVVGLMGHEILLNKIECKFFDQVRV